MSFPAGIDEGFEIYLHEGRLRCLENGVRDEYVNLPDATRYVFRAEMYQDAKAIYGLKRMGYSDPVAMELKFVGCRYGALDSKPDLTGGITMPDAPVCDDMQVCPGFSFVCLIPDHLSRQEYRIAQYIGKGLLDKEICDRINITLPTCRTFQSRIHDKLHVNNRVEVALWAQNIGIV